MTTLNRITIAFFVTGLLAIFAWVIEAPKPLIEINWSANHENKP